MPVPEALIRLSQDPVFWSALLADDDTLLTDGPGVPDSDASRDGVPDELRVSLPVAGGYGLVLDLDLARGEQSLGLRGPATSEPVQLGRAAPGRPHPAVLTWTELELFGRVIALEDPYLPHPGLVVALLSRFAPVTADDDAQGAAAVLTAAYRSLRRDTPAVADTGPEQDPLPLFRDEAWWPRPPQLSDRVLSEADIAELLTPAPVGVRVRGTSRFPSAGLAELVRRAADRLTRLPEEDWFADTRVRPLARRITESGDLGPVPELLGVLTEAGCDHPTVLDALSEPVVVVEACWMVETIAGAAPGSLLRRHLVAEARLG